MASNINSEYEGLVSNLADRAKLEHEDNPEWSRADCVNQAICDGFIYGSDQAYVLAHALINGIGDIKYGREITSEAWWAIEEELVLDTLNDLQELVPDSEWE